MRGRQRALRSRSRAAFGGDGYGGGGTGGFCVGVQGVPVGFVWGGVCVQGSEVWECRGQRECVYSFQ